MLCVDLSRVCVWVETIIGIRENTDRTRLLFWEPFPPDQLCVAVRGTSVCLAVYIAAKLPVMLLLDPMGKHWRPKQRALRIASPPSTVPNSMSFCIGLLHGGQRSSTMIRKPRDYNLTVDMSRGPPRKIFLLLITVFQKAVVNSPKEVVH